MFYFWLALIIFLGIVEVATVNLTTIWFVISGLISLFLSFFVDEFIIQFGVFVILGIILLITTRKWLIKVLTPSKVSTNFDRIIGMTGIVTEKIEKNSLGEVKVDGKKWTAVSDKTIEVDSIVKVLEIDGVKLKVRKDD